VTLPARPTTQRLSFLDPVFNPVEGQDYTGSVATFFDPTNSAPASSYAASIDWGDGQTSAGTVSGPGGTGGFDVTGSHTYLAAGSDDVQITITGPDGQVLLVNHTTALIADAPLTGQAVTYAGSAASAYDDVVGSFTDANPNAQPGDFLATIQWGDGATSAGTVSDQGGNYAVSGLHTFTAAGAYSVNVSVQDSGGASASWTSTLYIDTVLPDGTNPLLPTDPTVYSTEGAPFSGSVGTFIDTDGNHDPSRYTVQTINWGDNSSSGGTVSGTGPFAVSGSHTYSEEGSFSVTATVHDSDGANFTVTSTAQVTDAAPSIVSTSNPSPTAGSSWSGQLATFSDADPLRAQSDYNAVVSWGDGQSSAGTIGTSGNNFTVSGTHLYGQGGSYAIEVTIKDAGGAAILTGSSITATVAGLTATGPNLTYVVGASSTATVATFSDSDGDTTPGHFGVSISWGDGTTTANPTVTYSSGFIVQAAHTYARQGNFLITTSITDNVDGQTATTLASANVTYAALSASSSLPGTVTSLSYSGAVATFTDADADTTPAHFAALTNWGDGTTSAGTVTFASGTFSVNNSHTYGQKWHLHRDHGHHRPGRRQQRLAQPQPDRQPVRQPGDHARHGPDRHRKRRPQQCDPGHLHRCGFQPFGLRLFLQHRAVGRRHRRLFCHHQRHGPVHPGR
jgi:hypothetical protein